MNGVTDQNKLPRSTTVVDCGDDATSHKTVVFIGDILAKGAKGSITDLIELITIIKNFVNQLPPETQDCLSNNADVKAIGLKYGIDDTTDPTVI